MALHPATSKPEPLLAELERAKAAAEAANEAKSRYLVAVSHEIRSPLNAIYGYAQLLERGDEVTRAEAGAAIRRSVDHLTNLAESLLEISQVENGVLKIRSGVVDIRVLLGQIVSMFRAQAIAKGITLTLSVSNTLPALVKTDQRRLKQVLINLVSNAIKYTVTGSVQIAATYRNQVATIDVVDTGVGIEKDDLERVFEPFERGHSSDIQSQPGIGLGLTLTRVLVQVLGGDITAKSTPGEGSCFRLKLMLSSVAPADPDGARANVEDAQEPRRTILIIEDDAAQRATMRSLLQPLNVTVHTASTGMIGIDLAARYSPDVVLLDIDMPGISGWETAERLRRAHGAALKIIMVSANVSDMDARQPGGSPHDAVLAKPIAFDTLSAMLHLQLGLAHGGAAIEAPVGFGAPAGARPYLDRLQHLAQIGHVLGFEELLAQLEQDVPGAASFVAAMREHMRTFDFASIIQRIENARSR